jgi:hypothetical protein
MSHSLIEVKGENLAGFLRKIFDRRYDVTAFASDEKRGLRRGLWQGLSLGKRLKLRAPAFLSGKVDSPSTRKHSDESGLARDGWIVLVCGFPEVCESLLYNVFDASVVLHVTAGDRPDQATVLGDALLHGTFNSSGNLVESPVICIISSSICHERGDGE